MPGLTFVLPDFNLTADVWIEWFPVSFTGWTDALPTTEPPDYTLDCQYYVAPRLPTSGNALAIDSTGSLRWEDGPRGCLRVPDGSPLPWSSPVEFATFRNWLVRVNSTPTIWAAVVGWQLMHAGFPNQYHQWLLTQYKVEP